MKKSAFTLIELLVVIVIIGVLSGIGISKIRDYQEDAKIAEVVQELQLIRKFFILDILGNGGDSFMLEQDFGLGGNPSIQSIIENYPKAQAFFGDNFDSDFGSGVYRYDNDGDEFDCGVGGNQGLTRGVQIFIPNVKRSRAEAIAKIFGEEDNLVCGQVFHYTYQGTDPNAIGSLHFHISDTGKLDD